MARFILLRLVSAVPTLLLASVLVFLLVRAVPGDPASLMLGDLADPAMVAQMRRSLGLDLPIWQQFGIWLGNVMQGDLGLSITSRQEVLPLVWERFTVSASMVLPSVLLASLVAVPLGMIAAWRQNSVLDVSLVGLSSLFLSLPAFWLGLMFLLLFGVTLRWLPVVGYVSPVSDLKAGLLYMVMPVLTLLFHEIGVLLRMARSSTVEVLRLDYVTHARAKGLSERTVLWRHVFPNAFAPTWTLIGVILGNLLGGIAVTETVFTIPGLGRLMVEAIIARDYPVIQGCLLFIAFVYVVVNLLVDLAYPLFNPRIIR